MAMGLSHAFETRNRKRSLPAGQFLRTKASGYPSWPGVTDSTEGRIHWRRPTAILRFSLATLRRTIHTDKAVSQGLTIREDDDNLYPMQGSTMLNKKRIAWAVVISVGAALVSRRPQIMAYYEVHKLAQE